MEKPRPVKTKIANRRSMRLVVFVSLLVISVLFVKALILREKNLELRKKQEALQATYASEQAENDELKAESSRGFTEEELFEIARQRFGLLFPNEILFVPEDSR